MLIPAFFFFLSVPFCSHSNIPLHRPHLNPIEIDAIIIAKRDMRRMDSMKKNWKLT